MIPHELPGNIFMQPWWLDIVAPGQWEDIRIEKGGDIFARWPIVLRKEKGFRFIEMPVLTQKLGPWIKQTSSKHETIHNTERSMLKKLIKKIPSFDKFNYNLDADVINYLPFIWEGFSQNSLTTFQVQAPIDTKQTWKNLNSAVRRDIRRAEESLEVIIGLSSDELYNMISATFERQGLKVPYSRGLLYDLYNEASSRERATIVGAKDNKGVLHAAEVFLHDDKTTYYLAGGFDSESEVPGAVSLVLWEGIKEAQKRGNTFDFEGSSIKSIERYFSSFGSKPVHFHHIQGISKKYAPFYYAKQFIKKMKQ
ncbi:GNAT family N-acetyltransferase [Gracilimonas sp.]|uniref:GNAT family N-acetyltransferase n=1 Tax=Gracilimonas sp. TaxID=1974203 RepID=UPI0032EDD4E0